MVSSAWRPTAVAEVKHGDPVWRNLCLKRVRTLLGVPAKYPSAIVAWKHVKPEDRHTSPAPAGTPEFFAIGKYGHVVVSDGVHDGEAWCFSTDIKRRGRLDRFRTALITEGWGAKRLGWAETLNGVRVYDEPKPAPDHAGTVVKVRAGDTMLAITAAHAKLGTDWADVWSHPRNKDLRALRGKPEMIRPGDQVWVP
jgi:hypothetical protein